MVQWLGLGAFAAGAPGSIPGQGAKILQAAWHGQKKKINRLGLVKKKKLLYRGKDAKRMTLIKICYIFKN